MKGTNSPYFLKYKNPSTYFFSVNAISFSPDYCPGVEHFIKHNSIEWSVGNFKYTQALILFQIFFSNENFNFKKNYGILFTKVLERF